MPNVLTDQELIQRCIDGDRVHQKVLFDKYSRKMMTLCLRYSRNQHEAEDFLQDGFIKVFRSLKQYNHKGSFEGWIRRIMVNTALSKVSRKSFKAENNNIEEYEHVEATNPEVISSMSVDEILKVISKLPEGYRLVFNLFAIEGYSHKEIAAMLNIEEGTSRSQLAKARKSLQKEIENMKKISL